MTTNQLDKELAILPTHYCTICKAKWRFWRKEETGGQDDSWSLMQSSCGECCDQAHMGDQIQPIKLYDFLRDTAKQYKDQQATIERLTDTLKTIRSDKLNASFMNIYIDEALKVVE